MRIFNIIIALLIMQIANAYGQQNFSGDWSYSTESSSFNIVINQTGDSIKGRICAIMHNGDAIDCARFEEDENFISIKGTVSGNAATVIFWSTYAGAWGKAVITKISDTQLKWKIIDQPDGVCFIPLESSLTSRLEK